MECAGKWVVMNQGGKIYNNLIIKNLFKKFGCEIYPTSLDSSHQNGPVERSPCTVSQGVKYLRFGAGLDVKFWPYAFMHILRICNVLPGQGQDVYPLFLSTGKKYNFWNMRVFGCQIWVQPTGFGKKNGSKMMLEKIFSLAMSLILII